MSTNLISTVQPGELVKFIDALKRDIFMSAWRLWPGNSLREKLEQFFVNKNLVKYEDGRVKFKPTIARIYKAPYGFHVILALYPGLSPEDLDKNGFALRYAAGGEVRAYQDASGWIHLKVYTRHLPKSFLFSQSLSGRVRRYPLALPVGVSRQGFVLLKLYKDEEFGLLVAGMPGWGKSVLLRQMLTAAVLMYGPDEVMLFLIDMKSGVEFEPFHHLPHTRSWAGNLTEARKVLNDAQKELIRRANEIRGASVTNITEYNRVRPKNKMSHCIVAIDEYADLGKDEKEVVTEICRKGRFAGMHPIICTQRPTVDVLPGATKALLPVTVCFKMSSKANSRYVLGEDNSGAAYLNEKGRAIFQRDFPRQVQVMNLEQSDARKLIQAKYPGVPQGSLRVVQNVLP